MTKIAELKEKAYLYATQHEADDGNYLSAEEQIEAMKAYAMLVMAENNNTKLMDINANL